MRRTTRPTWPTHRAKRHRAPRPAWEPPTRQPSTDQLAADLVRRGLASPLILGPSRAPLPTRGDLS